MIESEAPYETRPRRRRRLRGRGHRRRRSPACRPDHQVHRLPDLAGRPAGRARRPLRAHARPRRARRVRAARRGAARSTSTGSGTRADVVSRSGDGARAQQAVRWNLFQLAQATWRAEGAGVPAKGLTAARTRATTSGTPRSTSCRSSPTRSRGSPATSCASGTACCQARERARELEPARRDVPVAHDQRRGGVGLLPGRDRAVPHQRRHRLRDRAATSTCG